MLGILIAAVMLLIWNGSTLFRQLTFASSEFSQEIQMAGTALTLNVALVLFGWRRYVDLQHEAELRVMGERRAALLASTDAHSGLLNRKGFSEEAQAIAERARGRGERLTVVSLQMHRFKGINDRHGYEIGDALLRAIAEGMSVAIEGDIALARLAGDEFAAALAVPTGGAELAEQAGARLLDAISRPYQIHERLIQVGAFAGLAIAADEDVRIPDLLRRADIALDHAKTGRAARPIWFDGSMERALIAHTEIEQGIRFGLDHEQFVPFFEPQLDLRTGAVVGFEMLARWEHPSRGLIGPDVFIPVAEEMGLIGRLSEQVIGTALAAAAQWDPAVKISVNISPSQLTDAWLAERIVRLLTETGFPAERLVVEITESSLFADIDLARSIVSSLKNQGIQLALDDFGSGFSSLAHLRTLPFDIIKIDRAFVADLHQNRESVAIIRAVTTLAEALGVPVCVEGIEDEAALKTLAEIGCHIGQGWLFGKAMPAERAEGLLAERRPAPGRQTRVA